MHTLFPDALIHDPAQGMIATEKADVAFVCVPTPLAEYEPIGDPPRAQTPTLNTSIVKEVIESAQEDLIIVRSTVMPGTCDKYPEKNIVFQPEYLGETVNHPMTDQKARQFVILGGKPENRRKVIELYQTVYNANTNFREVTAYEAEVVKLTENRAIAYKVAQCQELYDVCEKAGLNYNTIREAVYSDDPRFNLWWTFVYPNKRGFSSKCIPKDVYGWAAWAESVGYDPVLTKTLLAVNEKYLNG